MTDEETLEWVKNKMRSSGFTILTNLHVLGAMHNLCADRDSIERYIKAYKCPDKQGVIVNLAAGLQLAIDRLESLGQDASEYRQTLSNADRQLALTEKTVQHRTVGKNKVFQTTPTNCFSACVASVLDVPIAEVPEACDGAHWDWNAFQDWLALRGMQAIEMGFGNGGTIYPVRKPVRCIITGRSTRECTTGRHAVVADLIGLEGFKLIHDPHHSMWWIDGDPTHAVFFVRL